MRANDITRRQLLGTAAGAALSSQIPEAAARPLFARGGRAAAAPESDLQVVLDFADGLSLTANFSSATDLGDYVSTLGSGFTMHNRRVRGASGDYLGAFVIFLRPDADGSRNEVVIEFGTEGNYSTSPPTAARVGAPFQFFPSSPALSATNGSLVEHTGSQYIVITYVDADGGETVSSWYSSRTLNSGERMVVVSPAASVGVAAVAYNVYHSPLVYSYPFRKQNATPIPIGTNWTEPDTGFTTSGSEPPTASSTVIYTATISGGGIASPVVIPVTEHNWCTRWRWQSSPRPIVRNGNDIVTMKAQFPRNIIPQFTPDPPPTYTYTGPMSRAGLQTYFGTPGGRPEIGPVTEQQAAWLVTGNSSMESTWRAQAEAAGSLPYWARDVSTGKWINLNMTQRFAFKDAFYGPFQIPLADSSFSDIDAFYLDTGHHPSLSFIPWLATDDPYYLEGLISQAHFVMTFGNSFADAQGVRYTISVTEPRGWAWSAREIFYAAGFVPESVPSWLYDRSYFNSVLDYNRPVFMQWPNATASPCTTVFKFFTETSWSNAFQIDFLTYTAAFAKWTGKFPEWEPIFDYIMTPRLALCDTSGASGWDYRFPVPYYMPLYDARKGINATWGIDSYFYNVPFSNDTPTSWGELFSVLTPWMANNFANWTDPATWSAGLQPLYQGYLFPCLGALAACAQAGHTQAAADWVWLKDQMIATGYGAVDYSYRFAFAPP